MVLNQSSINQKELKFSQGALIEENIEYSRKLLIDFSKNQNISSVEFEDLESAAFLGLCEAARNYREGGEASFKTFSYLRIRGAMYDLLRYNDDISRHYFRLKKEKKKRILEEKAKEKIKKPEAAKIPDSGEQTDDEIDSYDFRHVDTQQYLRTLINSQDEFTFSAIDIKKDTEIDLVYKSAISQEQHLSRKEISQSIQKAISNLSEIEMKVIKAIYFEDKKRKIICQENDGLPVSSLGRIHRRALSKLKFMLEDGLLSLEDNCSRG